MKIINISDSDTFSDVHPLSYRRARFLEAALSTFASGRVKRCSGKLGDAYGSCACILGLFTDNRNLSTWGYSLSVSANELKKLPQGHDAVPSELLALGQEFLQSVVLFSDAPSNWWGSNKSDLSDTGKKELNRLLDKYDMAGIASVVGLTKFATAA